jgi:hypothetical protein
MKRPSRNQITILILFVCFIAFYQFFLKPLNHALRNMATGRDAEQASSLWNYVSQKVKLDEKSLLYTNEPPIYALPSRNSVRLDIFGMTNSDRQEQILTAVKDWQTTNRSVEKLCVRFYEPEKARGKYGQNLETLLREEFIVLSNQQFGIILNTEAPKN